MSPAAVPLRTSAVYELALTPQPDDGDQLLGMWSEVEAPSGASFAAPGAGFAEPLWQVDLPGDDAIAERAMSEYGAMLAASRPVLDSVPARLDDVLGRWTAGVSFSPSGAGPQLGSPERGLIGWLGEAPVAQRGVSFGAGDRIREWYEGAVRELAELTAACRGWFAPRAWVATSQGDVVVARSLLRLRGDTASVVSRGLPSVQVGLHQDAVALALGSRARLSRALAVALPGAAAISARLALPGGPLLALPATWRFVNRVIHEAVASRRVTQGGTAGE